MPERVLISLEDVSLSFGGKPLFEELRLHVTESDRICLVGRNGAGKTTLMRLITGELEPDAGTRFAVPGLNFGYLAQKVEFAPSDTVHDFVLRGLAAGDQAEYKLHLADMVIAPLDLDPQALMGTLSGGQLRRAALARALVTEPDVLLLDEPTNHLDLAAIEWLEQYLASYRGALLCVSHDRTFLASVSRKVFWIDRHRIRTCSQGYAEFDEWAETVIEQESREIRNMEKKLMAEVDWTQGGVTGRRKRNQRRLRELHRLRDKLRSEKAAATARKRTISLEEMEAAQASKKIAEFKSVSKSFGSGRGAIPILTEFELVIRRGDRIGIIGRNGSGKSTFLRLLIGEMEPDSGWVTRAKNLEISYFDQNRIELKPEKTLWDTLCPDGGDYVYLGSGEEKRPKHVCGYLKDFLFDPRNARDRVSTLSGGQQNRLMLAKLLARPGNLLILDEPTNDLDMDTLDMLQELLAEYQGTLIIVSHDRDFLDRTVTEVLAFEGDAQVESHIGGYSDYIEAKRQRVAAASVRKSVAQSAPAAQSRAEKPNSRMTFKLKHELEKLPEKIAVLEKEIAQLKHELADPFLYSANPERFDAVTKGIAKAERDLEASELRWLELEDIRSAES